MGIVALIGALVQGLSLISGLIPGIQGSSSVQEIEAALALLAKVVPSVQNIIGLLQNPAGITQAQVDAAVASMDQHVSDWDNRGKA
jgi:hypothetical protein